MGEQHVSLKINEDGLVTSVGNSESPKDPCVICGKDSPYTMQTHIDYRVGYVEGCGQACFQPHLCSQERSRKLFTVSEELVHSTPNNSDLGAKVRKIYWENKSS